MSSTTKLPGTHGGMFSHVSKKSVARFSVSDHSRVRSPLLQEVRPEDIPERAKEWTRMDEQDYDDDYVASTDPIHPVTTDYSHPLDDDDGKWILKIFSPKKLETQAQAAVAVDFDNHAWSWGENTNDQETNEVTTEWKEENSDDNTGQWDTANGGLIAWGPDADVTPTSAVLNMSGLKDEAMIRNDRTQKVVRAFRNAVNNMDDDVNDFQQSLRPTSELSSMLHKLKPSPHST
jgi:hypothetical protein